MKIVVEVTSEELKECNFTDKEHMHECIISDLDDARAYPGFNVIVIVTDE